MTPRQTLISLTALRTQFGADAGEKKRTLLSSLEKADLPSAKLVLELHETLCFLWAYPDDAPLLRLVERMLAAFSRRRDLRRHRAELADSGIAGTTLYYRFFGPTARWLVDRHPGALSIEWSEVDHEDLLSARLPLLASYSETPGLDEADLSLRAWLQRLAGPKETDFEFLVRRMNKLGKNEAERDAFYEELDLLVRMRPGPTTPSRTTAQLSGRPIAFQRKPLRRDRPEISKLLRERALPVASVDRKTGERLVTMAREAMVIRHRDLDAFIHADARDVRIYACGDGVEIAVLGVKPERRLMLEAVYGYLMLKNGVPIGYVLTSALFGSSEIAYNVFDPYRGGEAAWLYGQVMKVTRQLYGSDTFTIFPYQLGGDGNTEGLKSGAWWFYQKLGFRARDPEVLALMNAELSRMKKHPDHRTSIKDLERLAVTNVFWTEKRAREDVMGTFPIGNVGLAITDFLAERFGSDRERAAVVCEREASKLLGLTNLRSWSAEERMVFRRWAPLILVLPGVSRWSQASRRALTDVVRKKGGHRESDYVTALDRHTQLRAALRTLARREPL